MTPAWPENETELGLTQLSPAEFERLAGLIYQKFGIHLTEKKMALVRGRLNKVLKSRGCRNFTDYLHLIDQDPEGDLLTELADKISTNHTYFFREKDHFHFLTQTVFPELLKTWPHGPLRFWCAGCATGEEPYSLALWIRETLGEDQAKRIRILATDISLTALASAQEGVFSDERVEGVPPEWLRRWFVPKEPGRWAVKDELKEQVLFKRLNFMDAHFPFQNQFHLIFCRNVMIYFDKPTKDALVDRLARVLLPDHYFFIGHSESLGRDTRQFKYVKPSIYRRLP